MLTIAGGIILAVFLLPIVAWLVAWVAVGLLWLFCLPFAALSSTWNFFKGGFNHAGLPQNAGEWIGVVVVVVIVAFAVLRIITVS